MLPRRVLLGACLLLLATLCAALSVSGIPTRLPGRGTRVGQYDGLQGPSRATPSRRARRRAARMTYRR